MAGNIELYVHTCSVLNSSMHYDDLFIIDTYRPEQMTKEVWDYIFFNNASKPTTDIPMDSLMYV